MVYISFSEVLIGQGKQKLIKLVWGLLLVGASIIVVYNRFLWFLLISQEGRTFFSVLTNLLPLTFFLVPILGTFAFLIFDRRPALQPVFLALTLTVTFGLLHWVRVSIVSIPIFKYDRYAAEWSLSLAFLTGIIVMWMFDLIRAGKIISRFTQIYRLRNRLAFTFILVILLLLLLDIVFIPRNIY